MSNFRLGSFVSPAPSLPRRLQNADMASALESVDGRINSMEALGGAVGSAITVAQSSTARIDALVAEVATLKQVLAVEMATMSSQFKNSGAKKHVAMLRDYAGSTATAIERGAVEGINAIKTGAVGTAASIRTLVDQADNALTAGLLDIDELVAAGVEEAARLAPYQGSGPHIKQVTGIDYKNTKSYLMWAKDSKAANGYVKGRMFYKVKFNLNQPGYFTSGSDEIFYACRALSMALFETDGVERDLVPPCNHWSRHQNVGGIGQCFMVELAYFSHCGGAGYWGWTQACAGIPETDLRGAIGFESSWENYDRHYGHQAGPNKHRWVNSYTASTEMQYTLCTSQNSNFKK